MLAEASTVPCSAAAKSAMAAMHPVLVFASTVADPLTTPWMLPAASSSCEWICRIAGRFAWSVAAKVASMLPVMTIWGGVHSASMFACPSQPDLQSASIWQVGSVSVASHSGALAVPVQVPLQRIVESQVAVAVAV